MNILIVEDDHTNQALLGFQAEDVLFDVNLFTADNGEEALQKLGQGTTVGLILLDLGMPRMDGFEFLTRLRATPGHGNTPVIVVTARDLSEKDHQRLRSMGVKRSFQKGRYDTQALAEAITELAQ
jgi:two-component system, chemotaxis family, sensor kinase CheA